MGTIRYRSGQYPEPWTVNSPYAYRPLAERHAYQLQTDDTVLATAVRLMVSALPVAGGGSGIIKLDELEVIGMRPSTTPTHSATSSPTPSAATWSTEGGDIEVIGSATLVAETSSSWTVASPELNAARKRSYLVINFDSFAFEPSASTTVDTNMDTSGLGGPVRRVLQDTSSSSYPPSAVIDGRRGQPGWRAGSTASFVGIVGGDLDALRPTIGFAFGCGVTAEELDWCANHTLGESPSYCNS